MLGNIMIISFGSAFMTNALLKNLEKAGFSTTLVEPDVKKIAENRIDTDIYILYASDFIFYSSEVLVYLKDICIEEEKPLCVIGYEKELIEIRSKISENFISKEFSRPFDMQTLVDSLISLSKANEERKKGKHIMLVDDDPTFLKIMQEWLSMKYNITPVRSGM
ncbi:MAG: hypothetical protein K5917_06725, partial [Clostridiales bacterium]|nr:hypothetical protein [Clostridiales bacterium]